MQMPMPARTLLQRLSTTDSPAWASYAPKQLREQVAPTAPGNRRSHQESIAGQIWAMSQDPKGCREVQEAMEQNPDLELLESVANELAGHVVEAMRCPYANHVLQLYITMARPESVSFVLDELLSCSGGIEFAAKHKFGCRVVQRLVEHLPPARVDELAAAILRDVLSFGRHPYGNYVLQNLLEHGTPHQRVRLAQEIQSQIAPMCQDHFGSAVVSSALSKLPREDMLPLAQSILHTQDLLVFLAHSRHGHTTVRYILRSLEGAELSLAQELLQAEIASLQASRFGRTVVGWLQESRSANSGNSKHAPNLSSA